MSCVAVRRRAKISALMLGNTYAHPTSLAAFTVHLSVRFLLSGYLLGNMLSEISLVSLTIACVCFL